MSRFFEDTVTRLAHGGRLLYASLRAGYDDVRRLGQGLPKTHGMVVACRVGDGRLFATMFPFPPCGSDADVSALLHVLAQYVESNDFKPGLALGVRAHKQAD